jgi:hypothetical protein
MIDFVQLILFVVILTLTALLVFLGIQVFFILKELRKTLEKTNGMLDSTGSIVENISKPIASLSSLSFNFKAGTILTVVKLIKGLLSKDDDSPDKKDHHKE